MTTPRLHLHIINRAGTKELIGDFADGPMGRREAEKAERAAYRQNTFLENSLANDASNQFRPGDEEHPKAHLLASNGVHVTRVFGKDQVQALLRVPGNEDECPTTLDEAKALEARRVEGFLNRFNVHKPLTVFSEPLTQAEATAQAKGERQMRLGKFALQSPPAPTTNRGRGDEGISL